MTDKNNGAAQCCPKRDRRAPNRSSYSFRPHPLPGRGCSHNFTSDVCLARNLIFFSVHQASLLTRDLQSNSSTIAARIRRLYACAVTNVNPYRMREKNSSKMGNLGVRETLQAR